MGPGLVATDGARKSHDGLQQTSCSILFLRGVTVPVGEFAATKLSGCADVCIHSLVCPAAAPLRIQSAHVLRCAKCIFVGKAVLDDAESAPSSYLVVPGTSGVVAFDLIKTFGAASLADGTYSPTVLSLPGCSMASSHISGICVTEDGKFMAMLGGDSACIIQLPDVLVRSSNMALGIDVLFSPLFVQDRPW